MVRLTKKKIEVLRELESGKTHVNCQRRTLDILQRHGLAKLYVPIGWAITAEGVHAILTGRAE